MRIFFPSTAEFLTDAQGNGEGLIAWHLLTELSARGHDIVACVRGQNVEGARRFEIIEIGRPGRFQFLDAFAYTRAVGALLRRRGVRSFDVAHWLFPNFAPGFSPRALGGLPLVVGPLVQPWRAERRWWPAGYALQRALGPLFALRHAQLKAETSAFLVVDESARQQIADVPLDRVHYVPFGVRLDTFVPSTLPIAPRILYLGRLEPRKGVYDLLASMPDVLAALPDARLAIAGTGPEQIGMRDVAGELGIVDSVEFMGHVPADQVPALLAKSSLLCLPSHGEPFGMVLLEAMAAGRAVVGTRMGGPASIIRDGDGGALVPPGDVPALAAALTSLLSSPERLASAGVFNRRRVATLYSLEAVVDRIVRIYESVASGSL